MRILTSLAAVLAICVALVGCEKKESSVKKQTTITSPEGKTTITTDTTVDTKGKNPPPANGATVPATNP